MFPPGIILAPNLQIPGVCSLLEKKMETQKKKLNFNFGYDFVPQRENKSEKWNFIGGVGRERRAAMFLVP